jgi:hypothetical protein
MTGWAGRGYPEDDNYAVLLDAAVTAYLNALHRNESMEFRDGLVQAYALVTGTSFDAALDQVADAANLTVG